MILDYSYSNYKRQFSLSYINSAGGKSLINYNVRSFKTYTKDEDGEYMNWDGDRCSESSTTRPSAYDMRTFIRELPLNTQKLISAKNYPKLYTFDIEVDYKDNEFPEPSEAKFPISTISIVNDELDVVVLGIKRLEAGKEEEITNNIKEYVKQSEFYLSLPEKSHKFTYKYFGTEEDMIKYFLTTIVAKAPVLAGWNSIMFDWYYITSRISKHYPSIHLSICSPTGELTVKNYADFRGNKVRLSIPCHTHITDYMDLMNYDMAVLPIKESLSLDYISKETLGIGKIKYEGDLRKLYNEDFAKYVYYNAIDSVLVQLIDMRFKTLSILETESLIMKDKIPFAYSKIAISEAVFFNYWYDRNIKVIEPPAAEHRGELIGAYVVEPIPGRHQWICCCDFASLYPSTIITCNLSVENYLGKVGNQFTQRQIEEFKKDSNYFVSVNGCVYKNDQDYAFKNIQKGLKKERSFTKYLSKKLEATICADIEHIQKGIKRGNQQYDEDVVNDLKELGYNISCTNNLPNDLDKLYEDLTLQISYYKSYEQSIKIVMNSLYGGTSHVAFSFYNMDLANDITGESRNLTMMMEKHLPQYFLDNWYDLKDVHKDLGIEVVKRSFHTNWNRIPDVVAPHRYNDLIAVVAGDTDSLYISYKGIFQTIVGADAWDFDQKTKFLVNLHDKFINNHNKEFISQYYKNRHASSVHDFELETIAKSGVWLNVKKRYSQQIAWKDGKYFDENDLPLKSKGLEVIKSSYPSQARKALKNILKHMLQYDGDDFRDFMNDEIQREFIGWKNADISAISPTSSVNNYTKYVIDDTGKYGVEVSPGCPFAVRGLANYNNLRQVHNLEGDPIYGGKMRYYIVQMPQKGEIDQFFCYQDGNYPKWASKYAPINKRAMYRRCVLDPINRIITAIGYEELNMEGYVQQTLF